MNTLDLSGPNSVPSPTGFSGGTVPGTPGDLYSAWLRSLARMQCEMLRLSAEQFGQGVRILERFAACRSPADIIRLQFEIGTLAAADHLAEARQIVALLDPAAAASALPVS